MPTPLNEMERRWDDFQGGRGIELPDGETWQFYQPQAVFRPGQIGWTFGVGVEPGLNKGLSDKFSQIISRWVSARDEPAQAAVVLKAAWFLLARNYNITAQEFGQIMGLASIWPTDRQTALGLSLGSLVSDACDRYLSLKAEVE